MIKITCFKDGIKFHPSYVTEDALEAKKAWLRTHGYTFTEEQVVRKVAEVMRPTPEQRRRILDTMAQESQDLGLYD